MSFFVNRVDQAWLNWMFLCTTPEQANTRLYTFSENTELSESSHQPSYRQEKMSPNFFRKNYQQIMIWVEVGGV